MDKRRLGTLPAIVLGLILALYLGGLFGQIIAGYSRWLSQDGFGGNAQMPPISLNPLHCAAFVFTADGMKGLLFIVLVGGGIVLFVKLHKGINIESAETSNTRIIRDSKA
jgi:hypothetical protein